MWSSIPLVRLIIPFILGIVLAEIYGDQVIIPFYFLRTTGAIVVVGTLIYGVLFNYWSRWIFGLAVIIFMLGLGFMETQKLSRKESLVISGVSSDTCIYVGTVREVFEQRERSCRGLLQIHTVKDGHSIRSINASVMVYTQPDSLLPMAGAGSSILFVGKLTPSRAPANPAEFDYKQYLARKGIYHTTFLKNGEWKVLSSSGNFNLVQYAESLRQQLLDKLNIHGFNDKHYGVSAALLLGDDSQLDNEIREVYSRAGAMHILCVSGLHVGVIFMVLTHIFGFLKQFRPGRILLPIVLILSIWSYALITGLAPPVTRASFMISFIIVGNTLSRYRNVYNTLAAAAFFMLLLNPYALFGAGFQLSYAAVLGIVFLQKPVYNILYFKHIIIDKTWAITSVSIAAQIGTLPIIIYYFHQVPLYSLLTNLIVIPLSSLIIYSGILLFILPSLSLAAVAAAWILKTLIRIMDAGVSFVERLPFAVFTDISIDLISCMLLYGILIALCIFLVARKKNYFLAGLLLILMSSGYRSHEKYNSETQTAFIVYAVTGHSAYDVIQGRTHTFFADSALHTEEGKMNYSIKPHWLARGLNDPEIVLLPSTGFASTEHGTCKIINGTCNNVITWQGRFPRCHPPVNKPSPDYLILRGDCPFTLQTLLKWFNPGVIILDSSVPWWKAKKLRAEDQQVEFWDVREKGAFIWNYRL